MESFPLISGHRCGIPRRALVSKSMPNMWTNPDNLGGRMCVLALCGIRGNWLRGPLNRKAAFLSSLERGSKFCRIWKAQDSLSLKCPDYFQMPWLTGLCWLASALMRSALLPACASGAGLEARLGSCGLNKEASFLSMPTLGMNSILASSVFPYTFRRQWRIAF